MSAISVDKDTFEKETKEGIVVADFYTKTCGPCLMMNPVLEQCSEVVKVVKLNAAENPEVAIKFGVKQVPTLIFFKDGKEVNRTIGVKKKEEILKVVESL